MNRPQMSVEELIDKVVSDYLEDDTLENLLEELDVTPSEAMKCLFSSGLIDKSRLEEFLLSDIQGIK